MTTTESTETNGSTPATAPPTTYITRLPSNADATKASDGDSFGEYAMIAVVVLLVIIAVLGLV